ncbi:MAG: tyrosine-type recombinase/integrase, partial [Acidimicrobiales bacterium]
MGSTGSATLAELADEYVTGRLARGEIAKASAIVIRERLASLARTTGVSAATDLDRAALLRWQASVGHLSQGTRRTYQSAVWCFVRWLVAEGILADDPTIGLAAVREPRRLPRALVTEDVRQVLRTCPDARTRAMVWLMVGCGLRRVEVSRLQVRDYDELGRTIQLHGKAGHERMIPTPVDVASALDCYIAVRGHRDGPLFQPDPHANRWTSDGHLSPARVGEIVGRIMTR